MGIGQCAHARCTIAFVSQETIWRPFLSSVAESDVNAKTEELSAMI